MNFKKLHQQDMPLLLCNVWDAISAKQAQQAGYQAMGTSSAAIASLLGYPDGEVMPFPELLYMVKRIISASDLPLTVDIESGYSRNPQIIAKHIQTLAQYGVAGINLEDSFVAKGRRNLLAMTEFAQILREVKSILNAQHCEIFLNVRTDSFLLGHDHALAESILRGQHYLAAGADGLFVPCMTREADIAGLIAAVNLPINVMCMPELPDFHILQNLGVKRISMGNFIFEKINQHLLNVFVNIRADQSFTQVF